MLNFEHFYDPLIHLLEHMQSANFLRAGYETMVYFAPTVEDALDYIDGIKLALIRSKLLVSWTGIPLVALLIDIFLSVNSVPAFFTQSSELAQAAFLNGRFVVRLSDHIDQQLDKLLLLVNRECSRFFKNVLQ